MLQDGTDLDGQKHVQKLRDAMTSMAVVSWPSQITDQR